MIERAYQTGEARGLAVWTQDEAGPYQTKPYVGGSWQPEAKLAKQPHEYVRDGTAKLLTLFHPTSGRVRVKGVTRSTNAILHPWLKDELRSILKTLPAKPQLDVETNRLLWETWQAGLSLPITLSQQLPALRTQYRPVTNELGRETNWVGILLIWDNLKGHYTPEMVLWLFEHGVMPLYTPLGGSWLNMAESMQRILVRRGLAGQYPQTPDQIIALLEGVAHGWNLNPTPFEWGGTQYTDAVCTALCRTNWVGKRQARRQRSRGQRRHPLGGSGACTRHPIRRRSTLIQQWQSACQVTH